MTKTSKTIFYVCQGPYPWEVRVEKFCESFLQAGYQCVVVCRWNGEPTQREICNGLHIVRVGYKQASLLSSPISFNPIWRSALRRLADEFQPDLIIAREMLLAEACASASRGRCAVIMDMAEHYPAAMRSWKKYRETWTRRLAVHTLGLPDLIEKRAVQSCDAIITVCEENLLRVQRAYNFAAHNMCVVHNTPWLHAYDNVRLGCSSTPKVFSYQGWLTRERGVERLVRAFDDAAGARPEIELVLAGSGESMADVEDTVLQSRHKSQIHMLGAFSRDQLHEIISRTDIGVIPFDSDEFRHMTIPNKLFDYMMCGKPVIVSDCVPMARIINDNHCGIVVDMNFPGQLSMAIKNIQDYNLQDMSQQARFAAQNRYNWEYDAEHLLQFVNKWF